VLKLRQIGLAMALAISAGMSWGTGAAPSVAAAQMPPPECRYDDVLTQHRATSEWRITLLDSIYMVTRDYTPTKLVSVSQAGIEGSGKIRALVINDLAAMAKAARKAGAPLRVTSAYRGWALQKDLYQKEVEKFGLELGRQKVARPGHSEHQLGTAIDFTSAGSTKSAWRYDDWGQTAAGDWLSRNGWKYGFVLSYPDGETDVTCYIYEPWHYRYVGRQMAADFHASGLTLREYLWQNFE
jgi:D-alanyl-D-alanine carboxypeptidase